MMPNLVLLAGIAVDFDRRKHPLRYLFAFISQFYTNLLIIVSCALAFLICSHLLYYQYRFTIYSIFVMVVGYGAQPLAIFCVI